MTAVCNRVDKGVKQDIKDWDKAVNSISSTNRWVDKASKPRIGTVFAVFVNHSQKNWPE